jgi:hypothetical protein
VNVIDLNINHQNSYLPFAERIRLAASGYETSFYNLAAVAQTRCGEVGPDLLKTVLSKNLDRKPICLCQRNILTGVRLGCKQR